MTYVQNKTLVIDELGNGGLDPLHEPNPHEPDPIQF